MFVLLHDCYLAECKPPFCCYMPHEPDGPWSSLVHSHSPPTVLWFLFVCQVLLMCWCLRCVSREVPDSPLPFFKQRFKQ